MKENIFDVLMYLFENYMEDEAEILPDSDVIRTELLEAGFESCEVSKAFDWLDSLKGTSNNSILKNWCLLISIGCIHKRHDKSN